MWLEQVKWQDDPDLQTYGISIPDGEEWRVKVLAEPEKIIGKFGPVWTMQVSLLEVNGAPFAENGPIELRIPRGLIAWLAKVAPDGIVGRRFAIKRSGKGLETRHDAHEIN